MSARETHTLIGGQVLYNVHPRGECSGEHCCIHHPSMHHMREWEQMWCPGLGMYRVCPGHNEPHPDPDSGSFLLVPPHYCECKCCDADTLLSLDVMVADLRNMIDELDQ